MSLQTRLASLVTAIGTDIKSLSSRVTAVENSEGIIDRAERTSNFDAKAVGVTPTFVEGLSISVPGSAVPYAVSFDTTAYLVSGTAAIAAQVQLCIQLQEYWWTVSGATFALHFRVVGQWFPAYTQVTAVSKNVLIPFHQEKIVDPHVSQKNYRIVSFIAAAAPANWTAAVLYMGNGTGVDDSAAVTEGIPPGVLMAKVLR